MLEKSVMMDLATVIPIWVPAAPTAKSPIVGTVFRTPMKNVTMVPGMLILLIHADPTAKFLDVVTKSKTVEKLVMTEIPWTEMVVQAAAKLSVEMVELTMPTSNAMLVSAMPIPPLAAVPIAFFHSAETALLIMVKSAMMAPRMEMHPMLAVEIASFLHVGTELLTISLVKFVIKALEILSSLLMDVLPTVFQIPVVNQCGITSP
jgi:hypothetical protein